MKFKVGDKVRVKSLEWYNASKDKSGDINSDNGDESVFTEDMPQYCGKEYNVSEVCATDGGYYILEECKGWQWCDYMLEDAVLPDMVNAPPHYNSGAVECIKAIEASMTPEAYRGYLKGNIMKYLWRYEKKEKPLEDVKKAQYYLVKLIEALEI